MRIFDSSEHKRRNLIPPTPAQDAGTAAGRVVERLKQVYDPEIPVNIYDLGLIYRVDVDEATGVCEIDMTLTSPNCPEAHTLPAEAQQAAEEVEGVERATVRMVWDPPWDREKMSDEAKLALGLL